MGRRLRWGGVAAMVGGALFAVLALVMASMPRGCIGAECATREGRDTGIAGGALLMLALLLVVAGAAGLVIRARHAGRFGRLGITSVVVGAVAAVLLFIGTVLNTQDSSLVPLFIIPGLIALIVGFVLLSVAVLRARVLPRWAIMPLLALLIGLSRVYVGEHWATDIVGGWFFGGAWLLVSVAAHRWWAFRGAKS